MGAKVLLGDSLLRCSYCSLEINFDNSYCHSKRFTPYNVLTLSFVQSGVILNFHACLELILEIISTCMCA